MSWFYVNGYRNISSQYKDTYPAYRFELEGQPNHFVVIQTAYLFYASIRHSTIMAIDIYTDIPANSWTIYRTTINGDVIQQTMSPPTLSEVLPGIYRLRITSDYGGGIWSNRNEYGGDSRDEFSTNGLTGAILNGVNKTDEELAQMAKDCFDAASCSITLGTTYTSAWAGNHCKDIWTLMSSDTPKSVIVILADYSGGLSYGVYFDGASHINDTVIISQYRVEQEGSDYVLYKYYEGTYGMSVNNNFDFIFRNGEQLYSVGSGVSNISSVIPHMLDGRGMSSGEINQMVRDYFDEVSAPPIYVGVNGKARQVTDMYVGVNGKARKVTAIYVGVNGKARKVF